MKKIFAMMMFAAAALVACEKGGQTPEDPNTLTYAGVTYKTVTLSNGQTWMAEPLRFVPEGLTVSDDPKSGHVWYPYEVKDGTPTALKDAESIAKLGYLYDAAAAFGVDAITPDNFNTFEGTQGICPEGWHLPTRADFLATFGYATKNTEETSDPENKDAVFYTEENKGGSCVKADESGFNVTFTGAITAGAYSKLVIDDSVCNVEAYKGANRMNYFIGSTPYKMTTNEDGSLKNAQYYAGMTSFTKVYLTGRLTAAYCAYDFGGQVRCVKNK